MLQSASRRLAVRAEAEPKGAGRRRTRVFAETPNTARETRALPKTNDHVWKGRSQTPRRWVDLDTGAAAVRSRHESNRHRRLD
jgi:hypothetical protein